MSLSKFFIDRPIFAGVISVIIFLAGVIAMTRLPISEYPEVVPPSVVVTAIFPGANPQTIADTVATPLEEQINGVENMLYMQSQANSDGNLTLTPTFKLGTDPDLATQLVQNRVNQALPRLPDVTRNLGVTTVKSSPDLTMVVHLKSIGDRYDMLYLRNYATLNVKDQLAKIEGIGSVQLFGSGDYAMRLWLNPQKIAELGLTADDVVNAVRRQNVRMVPPGFVPLQDKQYLVSFAQLPEGATLDRTENVIREMSDIALKEPGVESAVAFPGLSINGFINSPSAGIVFETLKPFEQRTTPDLSGFAISQKLQAKFAGIGDSVIAIFPPPPVNGLGTIAGFKLQVEDRTDQGDEVLNQVMAQVQAKAAKAPELMAVFSNFNIGVPQLYAHVDRIKAMQLGVEVQDIFDTMQTYLGSIYVNDFNRFGRTYEVIAQADTPFRTKPDDILRLQIRNASGQMVPLGAVVDVSQTT